MLSEVVFGLRFKGVTLVCLSMVCLVLVLSCLAATANAAPSLSISWYKDNGYSMGNDMSGQWTLNTDVSQDVSYVEFSIDGLLQLNDTAAPFIWSFNTSNYTQGLHIIKAVAYNSSGEAATAMSQRNFVPFPMDFVVGIFALVIVTLVVTLVGAIIRVRKKAKQKT